MGLIKYKTMIVTGKDYEAEKLIPGLAEAFGIDNEGLKKTHEKAKELFGPLVSEFITSDFNGYKTFMIAPDGSKEGREETDEFDHKRQELADYIDDLAFEDGSNSIFFTIVSIDECYDVEVERSNKKEGEMFEF